MRSLTLAALFAITASFVLAPDANAAGKSPLDYARANGYAQIEKLLESRD